MKEIARVMQFTSFPGKTSMATINFSGDADIPLDTSGNDICLRVGCNCLFIRQNVSYVADVLQKAMGDDHFHVYRHVLLSANRLGVRLL